MDLIQHHARINQLKQKIGVRPDYQVLLALLSSAQYLVQDFPDEKEYCYKISDFVKQWSIVLARNTQQTKYLELYYQCLLFEAKDKFESYLIYMEKNREPKKRFYLPRQKTLKTVVNDLQDLEDRLIEFYGLSLASRVGKSTLCIFFLSWILGKRPNSHNAMSGHSGILADGFYNETLNLIDTEEYTFHEVYPDVKITKKSAEKKEITLNDPDRFATLTCRGIEGTWTGAVDVSPDGYLYVDDLVRDREESLNPTRLENRYQDYLNILVDRKKDGARELMVGTRWNVLDPLGRIEQEKKNDPRYRFRKIPALNENDESNFDYLYGCGFSTKYYLDMRAKLDKNEWMAKFQQSPFIREGLLFPEDDLRYFNGILPEGGFIRVVSVGDVAWGGGDAFSQPIGFEYENGDVYIVDWIFNRGAKEVTIPLVAGKIMDYKIQQTNFEANNGGEMYAQYIDEFLAKNGYKCSITSTKAPTTMAKMAKIIQYSGDIKRRFIFLRPNHEIKRLAKDDDASVKRFMRSQEYDKAMEELTFFVQLGKNEHDDAPDSLAQLERFIEGGFTAQATIIKSPI